jgi:acetyl-CoA acetyltransferase
MSLRGKTAIVGLGMTAMGRNFNHSTPLGFAAEAIQRALADAGLSRDDLDGLLYSPGVIAADQINGAFSLQQMMGIKNLRLTAMMVAGGASAGAMVMHAAQAIAAGMASTVACVFADAPLSPPSAGGGRSSDNFGRAQGINATYGMFGAASGYAMVARAHMHRFGTTHEQLGTVALAQRAWANLNPDAQLHDRTLTMAEYHSSRWISEPLHLYDCCLVSNGGICVIVTSAERARDLRKPPVYVLGMGQGHPGGDPAQTLSCGAPIAKRTAFAMAGVELKDFDVVQLYDCFTITVIVTLEDYGFCAKGEGGPFVTGGRLGPEGTLPLNTGGGELSAYYMWGMTPLSEGVIQVRGEGGKRQVPKHNLCLVSGNGGILSTHSTLVLGASV